MKITPLVCPHCEASFKIKSALTPKSVVCPKCARDLDLSGGVPAPKPSEEKTDAPPPPPPVKRPVDAKPRRPLPPPSRPAPEPKAESPVIPITAGILLAALLWKLKGGDLWWVLIGYVAGHIIGNITVAYLAAKKKPEPAVRKTPSPVSMPPRTPKPPPTPQPESTPQPEPTPQPASPAGDKS